MRRQKLQRRLGVVSGLLGLLGLGLGTSCGGYPDGLVVVQVSGLVSTITALQVSVKLDDTTGKNPTPTANLGDTAFVVYNDLQRFGVQVPAGTNTLCLCVKGNDTSLQVVSAGTAMLNLSTGRELQVTLSPGASCDVATLVCPAH